MRARYILILVAVVLLSGCTTRSISNSGYRGGGGWYYADNPYYIGELSELEVLGVQDDKEITEEDIAKAADAVGQVSLKRGDTVVVVQSGTQFPDDPMLAELQKSFTTIPLSGIPPRRTLPSRRWSDPEADQAPPPYESINKSLRLAAAQGNASTIIVYWGILESGTVNQATKTVSWVPVVGSVIPDRSQHMRIRLKGAVIDVRSGKWRMIVARTVEDERISAKVNRESSDQAQVARLKEQGYREFVDTLVKTFGI